MDDNLKKLASVFKFFMHILKKSLILHDYSLVFFLEKSLNF